MLNPNYQIYATIYIRLGYQTPGILAFTLFSSTSVVFLFQPSYPYSLTRFYEGLSTYVCHQRLCNIRVTSDGGKAWKMVGN